MDRDTVGALVLLIDEGAHSIFKSIKSSSSLKTLEYSKNGGSFALLKTGTLITDVGYALIEMPPE
jgi:hypothetical protein